MKIYANGCSFTYGDELISPATTAWPALLAKKINATVNNDAISGGTNYRTLYRTIKQQDNFDLYVIVWANNTRMTFYKSDNNFEVNFNPQLIHAMYGANPTFKKWGEVLYSQWYNELYSFKLWLQQIIQLQSFFDVHNKNYLMVNTVANNIEKWTVAESRFIDSVKDLINFDIMSDEQILDEYREIQYYIQLINKNKFYKWGEFCLTDITSTFPCGPNGHFLEEGHSHVANLLYSHLCSK